MISFCAQFFLVVLITFCTVTRRSGESLKKPIFLSQFSFQRSTSFHTTRSLLLLSFLVRDWLSHFLIRPLQKWLRRQFQSMLGLLILTTPHSLAACVRFSSMNIVHCTLEYCSFKDITSRQLALNKAQVLPSEKKSSIFFLFIFCFTLEPLLSVSSLSIWEFWEEAVVILLETMFMKKYLKSLRY